MTRDLGVFMGTSVALLALLTYTCIQFVVYAYLRNVLQYVVKDLGGADVAW